MSLPSTQITAPFVHLKGRLSEGATYDPRTGHVLWVDIIAHEVHRVELTPTGYSNHQVVNLGTSVGVIGLTAKPGVYICGVSDGYGHVDFGAGTFTYTKDFPGDQSRSRLNDGTIAPDGLFWIGTMRDFANPTPEPLGSLYRIDPSGEIAVVVDGGLDIPNGLEFLDDGSEAYWVDSMAFKLNKWRVEKSGNSYALTHPEVVVDFRTVLPEMASPQPDGMVRVDNGDVFIAVFGSLKVFHFTAAGQPVQQFEFPAQRITSVAFGGPAGDEMFVTTADLHHREVDKLGSVPGDLGGALFRVKVPGVVYKGKNVWGGLV